MKASADGTVSISLAWLALAAASAGQVVQIRPGPTPQEGEKGRAFSGSVVDGLGHPVPGVEVTVRPNDGNRAKAKETVLRTGTDGRYAGALPRHRWGLAPVREGWLSHNTPEPRPATRSSSPTRSNWGVASMLPYRDGDGVNQGLRDPHVGGVGDPCR